MLTNYVFMVPIKMKTTEDIINAYLKHIYSTFGRSTHILSDRDVEFTIKQSTCLAKKLWYTSPYTPTGNSIVERTHSFLKASLRKIICNHNADVTYLAHIAAMVYNVFPHLTLGEAPFYLMFRWDAYLPTLFKLLLPKI